MNFLLRNLEKDLLHWKVSTHRQPLLLRGARQVGKTSLVRFFGKKFKYFVEVNLEQNTKARMVFDNFSDPLEIAQQLSILYDTPIVPNETLLFLDEIQSSPKAIQTLRYFSEQFPQLHVIAAGSLLEFALEGLSSFGVGRITSLFLYPFSFSEFLQAAKKELLLKEIQNASPTKPLSESVHNLALVWYKKFLIVGGMPKAVSVYLESQDLITAQNVLDQLINTYVDDFAKYRKRIPTLVLKDVFDAVIQQNGRKFIYTKTSQQSTIYLVKQCLELLEMAGLIYVIQHSAGNGIPLGAETNSKHKKYMILDTAIFQRILGLDLIDILLDTESALVNKGQIAELSVGLELLKNASPQRKPSLYYWKRETKNSHAEVDFLIQKGLDIVPIEVKSGKHGKMQSLNMFLNEKKISKGIRTSQENFSTYGNIDVYPLYAVKNLLKPTQT